jgi:hypothetical protein
MFYFKYFNYLNRNVILDGIVIRFTCKLLKWFIEMAEVVKAFSRLRYADGFSANNFDACTVDNHEFSKRFIGIFLKVLCKMKNSHGNKFRNLFKANVFLKMIFK